MSLSNVPDGTRIALEQAFSGKSSTYPAESTGMKIGNGADKWQIRMDQDDEIVLIPKTHPFRMIFPDHSKAAWYSD